MTCDDKFLVPVERGTIDEAWTKSVAAESEYEAAQSRRRGSPPAGYTFSAVCKHCSHSRSSVHVTAGRLWCLKLDPPRRMEEGESPAVVYEDGTCPFFEAVTEQVQ